MSPGQIDARVVRRHLLAIDAALQTLHAHIAASREELASSTELRWIVERGLQLCAQNALDIATHLASSTGHDAPDYASAIDALVTIGALSQGFARDFRGIAGFRNVLVHAYLDVDPERLLALLRRAPQDFSEFARSIQAFLERAEGVE
jgi:uncharacterized protein YutE (UPF0331/DUF86 family)